MAMPTESRSVVRLFLASPGDVNPERIITTEIVNELNLIWSRFLGLVVELIRWETHAYPGVADYSQDVINKQVADEYDVFIGIMWSRFGTATQRAGSGTEEEFDRAYNRHRRDPGSVRIMFYFKTATAPTDTVSEQAVKVVEFKRRIGRQGVLYWDFEDERAFAPLLRLHLSRQIQEFCRAGVLPTPHKPGWGRKRGGRTLALLRLGPDVFPNAFRVLVKIHGINSRTQGFTKAFRQATAQLRGMDPTQPGSRAKIEATSRELALELSKLLADADGFVSELDPSFQQFMSTITKMAPLFVGWPGHSLVRRAILAQLQRVRAAVESGLPAIEELQSSFERLGHAFPAFRDVSDQGTAVLGWQITVWRRALRLVNEAIETYRSFGS